MLTMLILACKSDQGLQNNNQNPGRSLDQGACECPDNTAELTELQEELNTLRDRVVTLEGRTDELESEPDPAPAEPESAVVLSTYQVDCRRATFLYEEYQADYMARRETGTLYGYEGIWSSCPLVKEVEVGRMPHVTVAQVRSVGVDTTCEASYCPNTSADGGWYNSNSGGHIAAGGWDDMRMSPGMQLRYDAERGVIYTSSDERSLGSTSYYEPGPLLYEVTVIGSKSYSAPDGWY